MKKALVLAGGGSKGAYHIGVLMALKELDEKVDIITGTSIGALIGCMVAQRETDQVIDLWKRISVSDVIEEGFSLNSMEEMFEDRQQVLRFIKETWKEKRVNIDPLKKLIHESLNYERLMASPIDFGLVAWNVTNNCPEMIKKQEMTKENAENWLLASASCFPAFPICSFDGCEYIDGGYADNCPVELAINMGATELIVVDLNTRVVHPVFYGRPNIINIRPHEDLGSFLDFDRDTLDQRILMGYHDTLKAFQKLHGVHCTFEKDSVNEELMQRYYWSVLKWEMTLNRGNVRKTMNPFSDQPLTSYLKEYSRQTMLSQTQMGVAALDTLAVIFGFYQENVQNGTWILNDCLDYYHQHTEQMQAILAEIRDMKLSSLKKLFDKINDLQLVIVIAQLLKEKEESKSLLLLMGIFPREFSAALLIDCAMEEKG